MTPADIQPYLNAYAAGLNAAFLLCGLVGVVEEPSRSWHSVAPIRSNKLGDWGQRESIESV